ncbi:MAG TPA: MFS transporter [Bryobacteraceae bacterium]|nr:MFS transporter [Bryobacteraceae bacterium]
MDTARINVSDLIDRSPVSRFQIGIFVLCGLCLIMDGFDVQSIGYVAPALSQEWKIAPAILGSVLSAALYGVLFGSIFLSMLADKIGRRPVLVGACLFFALVSILTGFAQNVPQLLAMRFIAGLALGSIMPNAMALVGEYASRKARVPLMIVVGNGFTLGAAIGGFVAFWLIPRFGWRSVFFFGGAVPLVIGLFMLFLLPESLQFLALHGKDPQKLRKWIRRINPSAPGDGRTQYVVREERRQGVSFVQLFHQGYALRTVLLWTVYFMNLLNLYFLSSWLPTVATPLVKAAGISGAYALLLGTALQIGGVLGSLILGLLVNRFGFVSILTTFFVTAALCIANIGLPGLSLVLLFVIVFVAGMGIVGGQSAVNALAATLYPTDLRSTGVGAGLGIGRIGSIVGPTVAGILLSLKWTTHQLFLAAAVPALIAAVVMIGMRWIIKANTRAENKTEVLVH